MRSFASFLTLIATLISLCVGYGFLDEGCATQDANGWTLDGATVVTSCNLHLCNENAITSLNMNLCIANDNGQMVFQKDGYFGRSCSYCFIEDRVTLNCGCADNAGNWQTSRLSMNNSEIYNWFGYLSCFETYQERPHYHSFWCKEPPKGWQPTPDMTDTCGDEDGCAATSIRRAVGEIDEGVDAAGLPENITAHHHPPSG